MNKYLVYKISGGLNHMLCQINQAIKLSQSTDRILIIDTHAFTFKNDFNKYFHIEDFEYHTNYEVLLSDPNIDSDYYKKYTTNHVKLSDGVYYMFDEKSTLTETEIINKKDKVIFFTYLSGELSNEKMFQNEKWFINIKKEILNKIQSEKIKNDYIGVHYRNTDIKTDKNYIIDKIKSEGSNIKKLYLSTDDYLAYDKFKELLPDIEIIQKTKPFNANGQNIHYGNPNKDEVIMNTLLDMYLLFKSQIFIPSPGSSLSQRVSYFRKNGMFF